VSGKYDNFTTKDWISSIFSLIVIIAIIVWMFVTIFSLFNKNNENESTKTLQKDTDIIEAEMTNEEYYYEYGYIDAFVSYDYEFIEYDSVGRDIVIELVALPTDEDGYEVKNNDSVKLTHENITFFIIVTEKDTIDDTGVEYVEVNALDILASDIISIDVPIKEKGGTKYPDASGVVRVTIKFDFIKG